MVTRKVRVVYSLEFSLKIPDKILSRIDPVKHRVVFRELEKVLFTKLVLGLHDKGYEIKKILIEGITSVHLSDGTKINLFIVDNERIIIDICREEFIDDPLINTIFSIFKNLDAKELFEVR